MCGIAGIINYKSSEDKQDLLTRMIGLMHHRGPDALGLYLNGAAGLGHARLSILDLSGGDQPIHNEDKTIWVVFNGEIFNYPEIRQDLINKGHRFYTRTDTEVLVHLYEAYGTDMFAHLNGQFAFAIWDQNRGTVLLGRDRVGIRPLFYHLQNGRLTFASEVKAILADPQVPRAIDPETLAEIFSCWAPVDTRTAFRDVAQLPPGSYALYSQDGLKIESYWTMGFEDADPWRHSLTDLTDELQALLQDATRIRLRADVPVGSYLSGGLDSSYTTSVIKRKFNNDLCTFSVTFADERFDEAAYQDTAVEALQTAHRKIKCREQDIGEAFPKVIWHTEIPILRTAPVPLFLLSRLVRESDFKVVLTGEGADEMFAGYNIFKEDRVRRFWARNPSSTLRPMLLERLYPYVFAQGDGKAKAYLEGFFKKNLDQVDSPVYSHMLRWHNTAQLQGFFAEPLRRQMPSLTQLTERFQAGLPDAFMSWHPLSRAQYIESKIFLSNYLLSSQGDRMAMANSVEGRYPFLDHRVIEFASRLPVTHRLNGLKEKHILKQVARPHLPARLIDRPKQPYRAPISKCFFGDHEPAYVQELLSDTALEQTGLFNPARVTRLVTKCRQRQGQLLSERENMALVGILATQLLDQQYIRDFPAVAVPQPDNLKVFRA